MSAAEDWFGELGFDVEHLEADGWTWANLRSRDNSAFVVPRYGRGDSPENAVLSAKRRYEVEQIG